MNNTESNTIQVERPALVAALNAIAPLTDSAKKFPILTNLFATVADGKMTLEATNYEATLQVEIPVSGEFEGAFLFPARDALKALRAWKTFDLTITVGPEQVSFQSPGLQMPFPWVEPGLYPQIEKGPLPLRFKMEARDLGRAIDTSLPFVEKVGRPSLMGVHLLIHGKGVRWESTNGHQLSQRETTPALPLIYPEGECIIPASALAHFRRSTRKAPGQAVVSWDDMHVRIEQGNTVFTAALIEGKFPSVNQVIPPRAKQPAHVQPEALASAVKAASALARETIKPVALAFSPGKIVVASEETDRGQTVQAIPVDFKGASVLAGYQAPYLLDVLNLSPGAPVEITVTEPLKPTRFGFPDDPGFLAVLMPLRVNFAVPDAALPASSLPPKVAKRTIAPAPPPAPMAAPEQAPQSPATSPQPQPPAQEAACAAPAVVELRVGRIGKERLATIAHARANARPVLRVIPPRWPSGKPVTPSKENPVKVKLIRSESTGLTHVLSPEMKRLGSVGYHPDFKTKWGIAQGEGSKITFLSIHFLTREGAIRQVLANHGLEDATLEAEQHQDGPKADQAPEAIQPPKHKGKKQPLTPEQRSAIARKAVETRRRNQQAQTASA